MSNTVYENLLTNLLNTNFYASSYDEIPQIIPFGMENDYVGQYRNVSDDTQYPLLKTTHNLALLADELNQLSITQQNNYADSYVENVLSDTTNYSDKAIEQTTLEACEKIIENAPEGTDKETLYNLCSVLLSNNNAIATTAETSSSSTTNNTLSNIIPECARADRLATTWFAISGIVAKIRCQGGHNIWNQYITYDKNAPVRDDNGVYYKSLVENNRGHQPKEDTANLWWERTTFPNENYNQRNGNWKVEMQDEGTTFVLSSQVPFLNYKFSPAQLYNGYKISFVSIVEGVSYNINKHYTIKIDDHEYPFYAEGINKTGFNGANIKAGQLINCYYYEGTFYGINLNENAINNGYKVGDVFFSMYRRTEEENQFESILCDGRLLKNNPSLDNATELHTWLQSLPQDAFYNTLEEWENAKKVSPTNPFGQVMKMYYEPAKMYNFGINQEYYGFSNVETLYCYKDQDVEEDKRYYIKNKFDVSQSKQEQIKVYDNTGIYLGLGVVEYGILFYEGISYERYTIDDADLTIGADFYTTQLTTGEYNVYQYYYSASTKTYFHYVGTGTVFREQLTFDRRIYNRKDSLDKTEKNDNIYTKTKNVGTYEVFQYNYETNKFEDTGQTGTIIQDSTTKKYYLKYISVNYDETYNDKVNNSVLGLPNIKNITAMTGYERKLYDYLQQEAIPGFYGLSTTTRITNSPHTHGMLHKHNTPSHSHGLGDSSQAYLTGIGISTSTNENYFKSSTNLKIERGNELGDNLKNDPNGATGNSYWMVSVSNVSDSYGKALNYFPRNYNITLQGNTQGSSFTTENSNTSTTDTENLQVISDIDTIFNPGLIETDASIGTDRGAYISQLYGLQQSACAGYWYLKAKTHIDYKQTTIIKYIGNAETANEIDAKHPEAINGDVVIVEEDASIYLCHETSSGKDWIKTTSIIDFSKYCPVPVGCCLYTDEERDFSVEYPGTTWELDKDSYALWITGNPEEAGKMLDPILPKLPNIAETSHTHTASCAENGNHNHNFTSYISGVAANRASGTEWNAQQNSGFTKYTSTNGNHSHTITINSVYHTHTYEADPNGIYTDGTIVRPTCKAKLCYKRTS